ncbi:MAG: UDP-N-acetylmuramoyl-L-alanyl-D-glutamate--2,6-diaminopimelate ligase [Patescibacteria group bacterium]|nr:UDP-N-acetylmuramoyl-L-alanyl-D-glutamate--2,6-diaminopimelate ligase [Patescibacteria group bacterium]
MKSFLRKLVPLSVLRLYHYSMAELAAFFSGFPSRKMLVIGVTGTKGKTSTANFIWSVLNSSGWKTGLVSTANIRVGNEEYPNIYHMTMPGRFIIQGWLKKMLESGCRAAIVETTSEGVNQFRYKAIEYDFLVFTNLTPEHLPSHGGNFENYKKAKGKIFANLVKTKKKVLDGRPIKKTFVVNADSEHKDYFLSFEADKKITFGVKKPADYQAQNIETLNDETSFDLGPEHYVIGIPGVFNVYNALPGVVIGKELGISAQDIASGLKQLKLIPGRMEKIEEGQDFVVFVDYAHEKESMTAVLETAKSMSPNHIIVLLGAEGGGRDKTKRPVMGRLAGEKADYVIVSNVDPYEDEPMPIIEDIAKASEEAGKKRGENLFLIEDRRAGINKALSLAKKGDVVLITGKGAEQAIIIGGKKSPWDDRLVVREELRKVLDKQK